MLLHTVTYTTPRSTHELTTTIHRARRLTYTGCARIIAAEYGIAPREVAVIRVDVATETR